MRALMGVAALLALGAGAQAQLTAMLSPQLTTPTSGFNEPWYVTTDASGNLFVGDFGAGIVYKVPYSGGVYGAKQVIATGINEAVGVAVDSAGNVYVGQNGQQVVRIPYSAGSYGSPVIIASGFSGHYGVVVDSSGNVFVADTGNRVVKKVPYSAGSYGTPVVIGSGYSDPCGLSIDAAGNLYISDIGNGTVEKLTNNAGTYGTVTTLASGINTYGTAVDKSGNVYFSNLNTSALEEIPYSVGTYGTAVTLSSGFVGPWGVAADSYGNVFVVNAYNGTVQEFGVGVTNLGTVALQSNATTTLTYVFGGSSGAIQAPVVLTQGATGLDFTDAGTGTCTTNGTGHSYASGNTCTVVVKFAPAVPGVRMGAVELKNSAGTVIATTLVYGTGSGPQVTYSPGAISTLAGNGTGGYVASQDTGTTVATSAELQYPEGAAVDGAGNLYIADTSNNRIRKVTAATGDISTVAGNGTGGYVASQDTGTTAATSAELNGPSGVAVDGAGNLYIADKTNNRIRKVTAATGNISSVAGNGTGGYVASQDTGTTVATSAELNYPAGVAVDGAGNLFIADSSNQRIRKVTAATGFISTVAGNGTAGYVASQDAGTTVAISAELWHPTGVAVDGAGNLYIADNTNNRIRKVTAATGFISSVAGNGTGGYVASQDTGTTAATSAELNLPAGVAVDGAGSLYIVDAGNSRIRKVTAATGFISTVAGNGTGGYVASQDTGTTAATSAELNGPVGVAVDGAGNLYIADNTNNRIRKVTATAAPLSFASTAVGATSSDSPQTVTVNNIGNSLLTFANPATGGNPSISTGFSIGNSSTCPQLTQNSSAGTLAAGASCTDLISFSPTVGGSIGGQLVTTDNTLNVSGSFQTVTLSGMAAYPTPTVTSLTPSSGNTVGGNLVTITGTNLSQVTAVNFGAVAATSFMIVSSTSITAVAPPGTSGAVYVTVSNPGFSSANSVQYNYNAPALSAISPSYGAAAGGGTITITGVNLNGATAVNFGAVAATILTDTATSITATIPAGTAGTSVGVTVTTGGSFVSNSLLYTYSAASAYTAPTEPVGTASATQTAYVNITTAGTLGTISVVTQGNPNLDFKYVAGGTCATVTAYTVGQVCSVEYTFTPQSPGQRYGGIVLSTSGGAVLGSSLLNGTGTGPEIEFYPGTQTTLLSGLQGDAFGITVDASGNIYLANSSQGNLLKETVSGSSYIASTFGSGLTNSSGVVVDGAGNVYFADHGNNRVVEEVLNPVTGGYTQAVLFATPSNDFALAMDALGTLYIGSSNTLLKEVPNGSGGYTATTIRSSYNTIIGLAVDAAGNLYVGDGGASVLYKEGFSGGVYTQSTIQTGLGNVNSVVVDASGTVYVTADGASPSVLRYAPNGSGYTALTPLGNVGRTNGVALDGLGNLYVTNDAGGNSVIKITVSMPPSLSFGTVNDGSTSQASVQLTNIGNAGLTSTAGGLTTGYYSRVTGSGTPADCGTGLTAGTICSVTLQFAPVSPASGSYPDTYVFNDDSANTAATQTVNLSGTAVQLTKTITFSQLSTPVSVASTATLAAMTSNGDPVTYTVTSGTATISGTTITYTNAGSVTIAANSAATTSTASAPTVSQTVTVNPAPGAYTAPTEPVGTPSATQTAYVNIATAGTLNAINVLTQGAAGLDFNPVTGGTCAVGTAYTMGQACSVQYTFTPKYPGQRLGAVSLVDSAGTILATAYISGTGTGPLVDFSTSVGANVVTSGLTDSQDVVTDAAGNLYITSGTYLAKAAAGSTTATNYVNLSTYGEITGVAIDGAGSLYVTDNQYGHVLKIVGTTVTSLVTTALSHPQGIVADGAGNVYFTDQGTNILYEVPAGASTATVIIPSSGGLNTPSGLALDNAGGLYVANQNGNTISHVAQGATVATSVATPGFTLNMPEGLAVDAAGNLYIDDRGNSRFIEVPSSGAAPFVLGTQYSAYFMSIDGAGRLYVGDALNHKVFRFDRTTATPLLFPNTTVGATSSAQNFKLENDGNASLSVASVLPSNTNFGFAGGVASGSTPGCGAPVAPGAQCNVQATFTPKAVGGLSASGNVMDNSLNVTGSTQTVALSGTATQASQTIAFTLASPVTYGASPITLVATGGASGNPVAFSIISGAAYGSLSGTNNSVLTITGAGSITIAANQAGSTNYSAAMQVTQTLVVNQASKSIIFGALTSPVTVNATATLAATASNGDPVTYSVTGGTATISGTTITFTNAGSVTVAANSAATANYLAAPTVSQAVTVSPAASAYTAPTEPVGTTSTTQTAYVNIATAGTLGTISVLTQGAAGLDYNATGGTCAVGTAYTVGQACSVTYTFTPTHPGQRAGGITLTSAGTLMGSVYLSGTGTGPQAIFPATATRTNLGSTSYDMLGIAVDGNGNVFYVDPDHSAVREITAASGYTSVIAIGSGFSSPYGIAVDGNGNVFVGDAGKLQVYELLASSGYATVVPVGSGYGRPSQSGVAVDASGNLFVSDYAYRTVTERTAASGYTSVKTILSGLSFPTGVAVDASGNVFVADQNAKTVTEVFASSGYTTTQPVGSGYQAPVGITVDASGNVFVTDQGAGIKEVFADGGYTAVTTLGGAVFAYSIAQNGNGNLFLGAAGGNIAQLFNMTTPPTLGFGNLNDGSSSTQSFTVGNDGNAPLTAVAPGISGLATGVYAQVAGSGTPADCTASLSVASGATCNVSIEFAPITPDSGAYPDTYLLTDNNLNGSPSTTQTITLSGTAVQLTKTINFLQPTTPVNVTSSATLGATASNGDPVTYSITGGTASIVGSTITYTTVGSVTIAANSAATSSTTAAPQVSQTVVVTQIPQTINFTLASPVTYGTSPITLVATGGASGNPVTFSIVAGLSFGSLGGPNNSVLTITGAGTITIAANQLGSTNYSAATPVTQILTVNPAPQTITFGALPGVTWGAADFPVSASSTSGLTVSFLASGNCSIVSAATVHLTAAGSCQITASQAGNTNYSAATSISQSFTIAQEPITATGGSGSATYDGATHTPSTCTVTGNYTVGLSCINLPNVVGPNAGTTAIAASVTGINGNYIVNPVSGSYVISQAPSVTTVSCPASVNYTGLPQTPCTAAVTGANGLNQLVAVVYGANVGAGLASASAAYSGDTNHLPSSNAVTFAILPATQVVTFTPVPTSPDTAGDSVVLSATGGPSGQPVVFSVLSGLATLANDGVTLTYTGAGTVVVAADQAGSDDGNYAPATEATATIVVNPAAAAYNAGAVPVASQSSTLTATLNFPNGGTIGSLSYLTQGAPNLDFIGCTAGPTGKKPVASPKGGSSGSTSFSCAASKSKAGAGIPVCSVGDVYSAGQICTVSYIFQPTYPGQRLGAVAAVDSNGNPMGTSLLSGLGTGPQVSFSPGTPVVLPISVSNPTSEVFDGAGNLFVANFGNNTVEEFFAATNFTTNALLQGSFYHPFDLAIDGAGNLFVTDEEDHAVKEFVLGNGQYAPAITLAQQYGGFDLVEGIAVDTSGNVYVADSRNNAVKEIVAAGGYTTVLTLGGGFPFNWPYGLSIDLQGNLYEADFQGNTVNELTAASGYNTVITLASGFNAPTETAVDLNGDVYVSDSGSGTVKEVLAVNGSIPATPTVLTVASGLSNPYGLTLAANGNLFYSNTFSNTVQELDTADAPSVSFADTNVGLTSSDSPQTVTVGNNGYDPTSINPLTFNGVSTGTTSFVLNAANACTGSTSLEPGQTCALAVDFTPQVPGTPLTDAVTLDDNNLNGITSAAKQQTVALSGNGLQQTPVITVAPATINYATASTPFSATVAYTGTIAPTGVVSFTIDSGSQVTASCSGTTSPLTCTASYPTATLSATTHTITATLAATPGFLTASGTGTLTVNPIPLTVTAGSYSGVYDGNTHALSACTVSTNPDGLTCTNSPVGPVGPDVGGATVTPVLSGPVANYTVTMNNGSWSITQASSITSLTCPASVTYNGVAQTPCTASVTGIGGLSQPVTPVTYTANVNAGVNTASASATYSGDANHTGSTQTVNFTIAPALLTITAGSYSGVYDGNAHAVTGCTVSTNFDGITCADNTAQVGPDTGSGAVTPVITGSTANYTVASNNGSWSVTAKPVTVAAGSFSSTYDGNAHTVSACTSSYAGVACTNSPTSAGPAAGSGVVTPVVSLVSGIAADYTVTQQNGAWSIAPASSSTSISCPASVTYNGMAQTPCTATATGAGGLSQSVPVTYISNVNVGVNSASATATFSGDANHTGSTRTVMFTIAPAPLTVTAGSYSGVYDGNTHTLSACVISSNPDGLTCTNSPVGPVGPDVGGAAVTPVISGSTANYTVNSNSGAWSITARAVTVTAGSYSGVYNGSAQSPSACISSYAGVTCANSPASVGPGVGSGTVNPVVSYAAGSAVDYTVTKATGTYSITQATASITPNAATKVYGAPDPALTGATTGFLPADNIVVSYSRTAGETVAGSPYTVSAKVAANRALTNYSVTYNTAAFTITALAASVTPNAATKGFGTADPTLTGTLTGFLSADNVTATYTRVTGEAVAGSPYTISAALSPSAPLSNYAITYNTAAFTITKASPILTWTSPAAITYGTALSATQLDATANLSGGTFLYTPSAGTVLGAGSQTLSVLYTPTDSSDYTTASSTVSLTVGQATPVVTWPNPPSIVYGTATSTAQQTATATGVGGVNLAGSYFYTQPNGVVLKAGTYPLGVAFTPTDSTDYVPVSAYATLTVTKATPTVMWAAPAAITYGTPLSGAQLNATASVPGSFSYNPVGGAVLHAGAQTLSVTFTPNDGTDYGPVTTTVPLLVNKATAVITWPKPAAINYGTPLGSPQLNATANVAGTFLYSPAAGTMLNGGTQTLSVSFTPTDTVDYNGATAVNTITVNESTLTLGVSSGTQTYETWTNFVVGPTYTGSRVPTGTVTLYNNGVAWVTLTLGGNGLAYYTSNPPLSAGVHNLTASYSGDAYYPPGLSAVVTITVLPAPVNFQASCFGALVYSQSYQCTVNLSASTTSPPVGSIQYSLDGAAPVTVAINSVGNAPFTVNTIPSAGSHTLVITYGGQGNYAAAQPITYSFTTQKGQTQLLVYPSTYFVAHGSPVTLSGSATSLVSGVPSGSVTFYDNGTAIGTAPIGANGAVSYIVTSIAAGSHTYSASYAGTANYASATSSSSFVTAF